MQQRSDRNTYQTKSRLEALKKTSVAIQDKDRAISLWRGVIRPAVSQPGPRHSNWADAPPLRSFHTSPRITSEIESMNVCFY